MEDETRIEKPHPWIQAAKGRKMEEPLRLLLDVIAPLSPLAAQLLWVSQPAAGVFGARDSVAAMAEILESPDGIELLRRQLD